MLSSINGFLLKYPGLKGAPFYIFLLSAIATAGAVGPGIGLFYSNMFNATVNGLIPGLGILGENVALPVLKGAFNLVSGIGEPETNAAEMTFPVPEL